MVRKNIMGMEAYQRSKYVMYEIVWIPALRNRNTSGAKEAKQK